MPVSPIPAYCHAVTPSLTIKGAKAAIEFYKKAFGAQVKMMMETPNGMIGHAEILIGDSLLFVNDEFPQGFSKSPQSLGSTSVGLQLYVDDCDKVFARAVEAGAEVKWPLTDWFWGDRGGHVIDPFGHIWGISTHKEDVSEAEIAERAKEFWKKMSGGA